MTTRKEMDVLIVGGGTFGTALGSLLAELGRKVCLWVRNPEQAEEINTKHTNIKYHPDSKLPDNLRASTDLAASIKGSPIVFMAVPSRSFREVARNIGDVLEGDQILVHGTKGVEVGTFKRMSEIIKEETCALKIGALSGPNLARELMMGHAAGALVASLYDEVCQAIQDLFAGSRLRIYRGHDIVGIEISGSFKNILAIIAGVTDGLKMGHNTKALLLTRGLSEMARFGMALGADIFTFGGLAGVGDLVATSSSTLSRNHQVGERLAKGETLEEILSSMTQVAEGVSTSKAVFQQMATLKLNLPIVRAVYAMLYDGLPAKKALHEITAIPIEKEMVELQFG
jgi:glycerol-3-phosphate dehydrogenase (NAD(P)+)